jgi:hypothetical protein
VWGDPTAVRLLLLIWKGYFIRLYSWGTCSGFGGINEVSSKRGRLQAD